MAQTALALVVPIFFIGFGLLATVRPDVLQERAKRNYQRYPRWMPLRGYVHGPHYARVMRIAGAVMVIGGLFGAAVAIIRFP